jgi:hypothetical protein
VKNLLDVVASTPSIQLSTWVLVFQTLSLLANQKVATPVGDQSMVVAMIADSNLITSIKMFLSGTSEHGPLAVLFMADTHQWNVCVRTGDPQRSI